MAVRRQIPLKILYSYFLSSSLWPAAQRHHQSWYSDLGIFGLPAFPVDPSAHSDVQWHIGDFSAFTATALYRTCTCFPFKQYLCTVLHSDDMFYQIIPKSIYHFFCFLSICQICIFQKSPGGSLTQPSLVAAAFSVLCNVILCKIIVWQIIFLLL